MTNAEGSRNMGDQTVTAGGRDGAVNKLPVLEPGAERPSVRMPADCRNILMVYPKFPPTFLNFQYSLPLVGKRALLPPLGLVTIAALTPRRYNIRIVDVNCDELLDSDIAWADIICFSAMVTQETSMFELAERCRSSGKPLIFGGPYPTSSPQSCREYCDVMVLDEGEATWPVFLRDLERGVCRTVYRSDEKRPLTELPIPRYDLINVHEYATLAIQYSRGCPYKCEFCPVPGMFGPTRMKDNDQFIRELDAIYETGFRGLINIIDDNFIAHRKSAKRLLKKLIPWNEEHQYPFTYAVEASLDLGYDEELLRDTADAQIRGVFIGLETPSEDALRETKKFQNLKRSVTETIAKIQNAGLVVSGGFILGFDGDDASTTERQIQFVKELAIPWASVGLLVAIPGTALYKRVQEEGRLLSDEFQLGNQYAYTNIDTKLPYRDLLGGFRQVLTDIYEPKAYFERCQTAISRLPTPPSMRESARDLRYKSAQALRTITGKRRDWERPVPSARHRLKNMGQLMSRLPKPFFSEALKFLGTTTRRAPSHLPMAMQLVAMGVHCHLYAYGDVCREIDERLADLETTAAAHASAS